MAPDRWEDQFTDMLLRETVGGEKPPRLARLVLRRALAKPWIYRLAPVAAAAVLLAIAGWHWLGKYPPKKIVPVYAQPQAAGDYLVKEGGPVRRGSTLETAANTAALTLGDYVSVVIQPRSVVKIAGRKNAEVIFLSRGEVTCEVESEKAIASVKATKPGRSFEVHTELGTVSVVGTKFTVRLEEEENGMDRRMVVTVIAGIVLVTNGFTGGQDIVRAGDDDGTTLTVTTPGGQRVIHRVKSKRGMHNWGSSFARKQQESSLEKIKGAETPFQKEDLAARIQRDALGRALKDIEFLVLKDPDIAALMKTSAAATRVYYATLNANADYQALKDERKKLDQERSQVYRNYKGGDREARKERAARRREIYEDLRETKQKLNDFPDTVPELVKLKNKKSEAAIAFLDAFQKLLEANPEYAGIIKQLNENREWSDDLAQRRSAANRSKYQRRAFKGQGHGRKGGPAVGDAGKKTKPEKNTDVF